MTAIAASEVEGTSEADNWQNILVKGSSSIRTPADLAGKTIAVNALKGVGEVAIKAAMKKVGVDPNVDQAARAAVSCDALRAQQRPGRRDLDARAVPDAGIDDRRRPHRDGAGPGARPLLAERGLRLTRRLGGAEPGHRGEVQDCAQQVARLRAVEPGGDPRPAASRRPGTCGCRSGARSSTGTSCSSSRSTRRSSASSRRCRT